METYGEPRDGGDEICGEPSDGGDLRGAEGWLRLMGSRVTVETYGEPSDSGDLRGAK